MFSGVYEGRRVLVTGHTGFKGSWLSAWLTDLGAEAAGYSLDLPSDPSNFEVLGLSKRIVHHQGDVRDRENLGAVFESFQPEIVFHLAAQSLVRRSYEFPARTFETNVLGTMNVLECIRHQPSVRVGVIITSDKCYQNVEWLWGYREIDRLGGNDPYSASKSCAELVSAAYMCSFFRGDWPKVATARAGNVIGGGDWAEDRIVPDSVRAWSAGRSVNVRNPHATRPWQHVLEPLSGYLWLGASLWRDRDSLKDEAFNFGPPDTVNQSVGDLLAEMAIYWDRADWRPQPEASAGKSESTLLKLNCDKALQRLGWRAVLSFEQTVQFTSEWYRTYYRDGDAAMFEVSRRQIEEYASIAGEENLPWVA